MSRLELLNKLMDIFRDIFDDDTLIITEQTVPEDVENWDSIGHLYLVCELEDEFEIKISEKMKEVKKVSDILDLLMEELN